METNGFDLAIVRFFNAFINRYPTFDAFLVMISVNDLLRGSVILGMCCWAWITYDNARREQREFLLFGLMASAFALFLARVLSWSLPVRLAPVSNPLLGLHIPHSSAGFEPLSLPIGSSFPSETATVYFCLAAILWMVSRRLGMIALGYVFFVITVTRVYIGIHYPTDIIAGALLGLAVASLAGISGLRRSITQPFFLWMDKYPASFYSFLFVWCCEIVEMFDPIRFIAFFGRHSVVAVLQSFH